MRIPFYKPFIGKEETNAVVRVLRTGKLTRGEEPDNFEKEFSKYMRKKYAVAVNSGTSGLHLLVRALGWKKGDEIITTPFSYIASSNAIIYENATPVFVDIDPQTLNIDCGRIEEKITSKTKGILLVHILGLPVNRDAVMRIKEKYNLQIIEDSCETIGKPSDKFPVAKIGEAAVFSFHENKPLTTAGEGGMIVTDDPVIAKKCRSMRDQGRSAEKDWLNNVILGFNYRMTDAQAAFGREQLKRMEMILKRRAEIAEKYYLLFKDVDGINAPQAQSGRNWLFYFVIFNNVGLRDASYKALSSAGIESSFNYFPPIYNFPAYRKYKKDNCANADLISGKLLALPTFHEIRDSQIEEVANVIKSVIGRNK